MGVVFECVQEGAEDKTSEEGAGVKEVFALVVIAVVVVIVVVFVFVEGKERD